MAEDHPSDGSSVGQVAYTIAAGIRSVIDMLPPGSDPNLILALKSLESSAERLGERLEELSLDEEYSGPWVCDECEKANSFDEDICAYCGSGRT